MSANRFQPIELTNMIMIEKPETNEILVQNKVDPAWPGIIFPGGHVEADETIVESAYREALEETGLTIKNPVLVGIKEFPLPGDARYVVFLFKVTEFAGKLKANEEGELLWTTRTKLNEYELTDGFKEILPVFDDDAISEFAYKQHGSDDVWESLYQ